MNKKAQLALIILGSLLVLSFIKNSIAGSAIQTAVQAVTHVPVKISSTNLSLVTTSISLKGVKIFNPSSYPDKLMLDAPEVAIHFDLPSYFKHELRFKEVKLNMKELVVIRNKDGSINVNELKPKETAKKKETQGKSAPKIKIDKLYLSIGKVVYKDYSMGSTPVVQTFDINMQNKEYRNINDLTVLTSLIMSEALMRTTLSKLANLDVAGFKDTAESALGKGLSLAGDTADTLESNAKNILGMFK